MDTRSRRGESGLAMIILLVTVLAATLFGTEMANLIISEVLTAQNEANQIRAQNFAEMGLAFGWAAIENWSTWCDAASVAAEPACPSSVTINDTLVGGVHIQPQGGFASGQIDTHASAVPPSFGTLEPMVRVVVGVGHTTFSNTSNPTQLATAEAVLRQTGLVMPSAFSFAIFSNSSAAITAPASMPNGLLINGTGSMPSPCTANAGGTPSTDICQMQGPLYAAVSGGSSNLNQPMLGTVYANDQLVGTGVANVLPTSPINAVGYNCQAGGFAPTLCVLAAAGGSASATGSPPGVACGSNCTQNGTQWVNAGVVCNATACSPTVGGTQFQFPAWRWATFLTAPNIHIYNSAQAFYTAACGTWYSAATKITTIPAGVYLVKDQLVVFDNDTTRCLGNVTLTGTIAVYCNGGAGASVPCGSTVLGYPAALPSGLPATAACAAQTPCGDVILGGQVTVPVNGSGSSVGCTAAVPCAFTFQQQNHYAAGSAANDGTPAILAGGSIGGYASAGSCINQIAGVNIWVYGNGYDNVHFPACPVAGCSNAYILPSYASQSTPPCGTATVGTGVGTTGSVFIQGIVYALANFDLSGAGVASPPAVPANLPIPSYGWCLQASALDTVALQGSLIAENVYDFQGQALWDPSNYFPGFPASWVFCTTLYTSCAPPANATPLQGGSVTVLPLSTDTGQ